MVINGKQEARQLHIPTVNVTVALGNIQEGVCSCKVFIKKTKYNTMCYYDISRSNILEAHIFDYPADGSNLHLQVEKL